MKAIAHALLLSATVLGSVSSFAQGEIGTSKVTSCEIESPFRLHPVEQATLESKGYRINVKRSHYVHQRVGQIYEFYMPKKESMEVGQLRFHAVKVPSKAITSRSRREFRLESELPVGAHMIGIASSTVPVFARAGEPTNIADFSSFPTCSEQ